jgi:nicotinate phosphoribosyltransferase
LERAEISRIELLLVDILREGRRVYSTPDIAEMRSLGEDDLAHLDEGVKRIINPHGYHVSLTQDLWELKQNLVARYSQDERSN